MREAPSTYRLPPPWGTQFNKPRFGDPLDLSTKAERRVSQDEFSPAQPGVGNKLVGNTTIAQPKGGPIVNGIFKNCNTLQ